MCKFSKEFSDDNFLKKLETKLTRAKKLRSIVLSFISLTNKQSVVKVSDLRTFHPQLFTNKDINYKGIFEEFLLRLIELVLIQ